MSCHTLLPSQARPTSCVLCLRPARHIKAHVSVVLFVWLCRPNLSLSWPCTRYFSLMPPCRQSGEEGGPGGTLPLALSCSVPWRSSLLWEGRESFSSLGAEHRKEHGRTDLQMTIRPAASCSHLQPCIETRYTLGPVAGAREPGRNVLRPWPWGCERDQQSGGQMVTWAQCQAFRKGSHTVDPPSC